MSVKHPAATPVKIWLGRLKTNLTQYYREATASPALKDRAERARNQGSRVIFERTGGLTVIENDGHVIKGFDSKGIMTNMTAPGIRLY